MKKYQLIMNGKNFLVDMNGKVAKYGFIQNFYLEADSPEQAEDLAIQKIRANEELISITQNPKGDSPIILLEEMSELESFDGVENMESGKAWFSEKKWWEFWK